MANPRTNFIARLDWLTIILFLVMVGFGWMNIFSATQNEGGAGSIFDFTHRYSKQFYYILTALAIAIITLSIDGKVWSLFSFPKAVLITRSSNQAVISMTPARFMFSPMGLNTR